jgi:hypothetical protein
VVFEEWCMSMVRSQQGVLVSVQRVLTEGLQLPWLSTLSRMTEQYLPILVSSAAPYVLMALTALTIYAIWRVRLTSPALSVAEASRSQPVAAPHHGAAQDAARE